MDKNTSARVRFAPSPTGFLHVGGARTALFNWLYARATGGKFLLRIEDTDPTRSEARFTDDILESLRWLGFEWDEPPVYQSSRFEIYQGIANDLMAKGMAYHCDCSQAQLDAIRAQCEKDKRPFRYPGICRNKTSVGENPVVRLKLPQGGETAFVDLIRERIAINHRDMDDWVILRADKTPTYNFSVVVDDHFQGITHVLRGDDHINNTPKQILLYQMLGYPVPEFAHLPMILGTDRSKLSKRHGAASTLEYRKMGYLPLAMINFLVRLGWSHGDQEVFTIEELQKYFSLNTIGKAGAVFNPEKLNWLSGQILKDFPSQELYEYLLKYFASETSYFKNHSEEKCVKGVDVVKGKTKTILELLEQVEILLGPAPEFTEAIGKTPENALQNLETILPIMQKAPFDKESLEKEVKAHVTSLNQKFPPYAQSIRFGVTAGKVSPGLFEMLDVLGKEEALRRIESCLKYLHGKT